MHHEVVHEADGRRTFALVFEIGDEVVETLTAFAREHGVEGAHFHAVGALKESTIAYWNWDTKEYEDRSIFEQAEVASLVGNVTLKPDGEPKVHAHVVLGMRDHSARAGHLRKGIVRPTLELFLTEVPTTLKREKDEETGLALIAVG